jgi:hypothetical protein
MLCELYKYLKGLVIFMEREFIKEYKTKKIETALRVVKSEEKIVEGNL